MLPFFLTWLQAQNRQWEKFNSFLRDHSIEMAAKVPILGRINSHNRDSLISNVYFCRVAQENFLRFTACSGLGVFFVARNKTMKPWY